MKRIGTRSETNKIKLPWRRDKPVNDWQRKNTKKEKEGKRLDQVNLHIWAPKGEHCRQGAKCTQFGKYVPPSSGMKQATTGIWQQTGFTAADYVVFPLPCFHCPRHASVEERSRCEMPKA
ncbi:MAG: hypothetical protein JF597_36115 [Streptomyces sp.]|uniref:hypothetical protein n=1 Tax=Streptomyces sp. TaxID=1931 RepID=UPI0025D88311|nr:hypothetical protein [Streptomyces sp.]MBW8798808.1 hypothetical protein [Streptomyces sp.]